MPHKDPEQRRQWLAKWYPAYYRSHRAKYTEQSRRWRAEHRDEYNLRARAYAARRQGDPAYREARRKSGAKHYLKNSTALLERQAAYRSTHTEQTRARNALYLSTHPAGEHQHGRRRQREQERRARKVSAPSTLTAQEWESIKAAYGNRCAYCGRGDLKLTQDHVVPLSHGGAYAANNIVPACGPCNSSKGARLPTKPVPLVLL